MAAGVPVDRIADGWALVYVYRGDETVTHALNAGLRTFQELIVHEPLPLASLHEAVLELLQGRDDVVVFGAHAVNAYVSEPRMTQDVDLLSTRAEALAHELRDHLADRFRIAVPVRDLGDTRGYRLYQIRKAGNRHLVDVRPVDVLPASQRIEEVPVIAPVDLIASKVIAYHTRRGRPKSGTDWRDIAMLFLAFPDLKQVSGPVADCLESTGADEGTMTDWRDLVAQHIEPENGIDGFMDSSHFV